MDLRGTQVEWITRSKKCFVFLRHSRFSYDLTTPSPTSLQLRRQRKTLMNLSAAKRHNRFSTLRANCNCLGRMVSIKLSSVRVPSAPFRVEEGSSSALNFARSHFQVSIVATFLSISSKHVDMAFIAVSFSNFNFDCLFSFELTQFLQ